jgi:hypothetical protein
MEWINLHLSSLRSPEYVGSSPAERGTWLSVLGYGCTIECGGRLDGAALWKDRQWQQSCGVTLREVKSAWRLLRFDGDDVIINGYPLSKEKHVKQARGVGMAGAMARWKKRDGNPNAERHAENMPNGNAKPMPNANAEGEGKGKSKGREGEEARQAARSPSAPVLPEGLASAEGFIDEFNAFVAHRAKIKKPMTDHAKALLLAKLAQRPNDAIAALRMSIENGWQGMEWEWFDKRRGSAPARTVPLRPDERPPIFEEEAA